MAVSSTITFGFLTCQGGLSTTSRKIVSRVVRLSSKVIGDELTIVDDLYRRRAKKKGGRFLLTIL